MNTIPTEPIGSIPRPLELRDGVRAFEAGEIDADRLEALFDAAVKDTLHAFEATGSPVITDGEQRKPSFATYPLAGLDLLAPGGVEIPFEDGHTRQLPRLTRGPFAYATYVGAYAKKAKAITKTPIKQAVIAASAVSLIYPEQGIEGYSRDTFLRDLITEARKDIRSAFDAGVEHVQVDFTEGRLSVKLDPSKQLLRDFVELNNRVLEGFTPDERARIGVHTCPGGDLDSTHSADVDYAELLPDLFQIEAGAFYVALAGEKDPERVLELIAKHSKTNQRIFVGVIDPIDPNVETEQTVRDRVLAAARHISPDRLGTTDDCGFSPFGDDPGTARELAFRKIRARVEGTKLAEQAL